MSGCTTLYVPIPLTHPAEVNLSQYENVAFGRVTGNMAPDFKICLRDELIRLSHIRIMDRPQQLHLRRENALSNSYLPRENTSNLGQLNRSSVLLFGNAESYYDEETTFKKKTCERKIEVEGKEKKEKYDCTHYKRTGTLTTFGHIDFTEEATGTILLSKNFKCSKDDYNTSVDESPAAINKKYMYEKCLNQHVYKIFKAMSPWQEEVRIPFEKDYHLPNLEMGINLARERNFPGAIEIFQRELEAAQISGKIPKESVVNAYWNLGLAYEYSWQFDKADTMFRRAYEISGDGKYIKEIAHNERLKAEREELLRQIPQGL
ncbi:MAG: hypothetical protein NPINA01_31420 [Nitrospinaceae bacterium]|nr:MAG: hypothetical protein NPINA01_31420 [Nitrospinaceae bacterium]